MKDNDDIKIIGEKLRAEYLSDDMEEGPSPEMVARWIAIADQRRTRIHRRKKMLLSVASCAAVLLLCIGVTVTCILKPSSAVAGNEGGTKIESGSEIKDVYNAEEDIPENIREEFIMFPYIPEGYEFSEATVESNKKIKKFELLYINKDNEEIYIKEIQSNNEDISSIIANPNTKIEQWDDIQVSISSYPDENTLVYIFAQNSITIRIDASKTVNKETIVNLIKNAV